jgi:hypothetical protein
LLLSSLDELGKLQAKRLGILAECGQARIALTGLELGPTQPFLFSSSLDRALA